MRHPHPPRGRRILLAASAVLLAVGGLTLPASALPNAAAPQAAAPQDGTAGCGAPAGLASGEHTVTSNGQQRTFRLDVPEGYDQDRAHRLVVALHWWHGTSADVVDQGFYGLEPRAGGSTVFVAPQGIDNAWPNGDGRDVAFVDDVLNISQGRALRDRALQTNGCQAQDAPEPAPGSGGHVRTEYTCRDGYPVV